MTDAIALPVEHGRARYAGDWRSYFATFYLEFLTPGISILDVGSGRIPAVPPADRPQLDQYIGLDISGQELAKAPFGSYDHAVESDLTAYVPDLAESIDLVLSLHVLEHIEPLDEAIANVHAYLKAGGHFVALFSGRNAYFSMLNRLLPRQVGVKAMELLLRRPPHSVFPAHYDRCTHSELTNLLETWSEAVVIPLYRGSYYTKFFQPAQSAYLKFEDWLERTDRKDLATHYVIVARK